MTRHTARAARRGQALTEYAILLAAAGALDRLHDLTERLLAQPPAVLVAGGAAVLALVYVVFGRR